MSGVYWSVYEMPVSLSMPLLCTVPLKRQLPRTSFGPKKCKLSPIAFDREFQKTKLYSKIMAMKESSRLPEKQRTFPEKINYEIKTFLKAELIISCFPINI